MAKPEQVFKFKPFSRKQRKVLNWWTDGSPVRDYDGIIADGAIRSGKTVCMSLSFVIWAMTSFNGESFAMCGKTIGSFRRNVLYWLKIMLLSRGYTFEEHRLDNYMTVSRGDVTNHFYFFGGKDERSQDLIQGITLAGLYCDEVALMPESFFNQATARCSVEGSKWWVNCNPSGPYHWFKTEWIDRRQEKGLLYLHFMMDDNLSLSEKIKDRYRAMYSGVFYKRYILGQWVAAEGLIYDMFSEETNCVSLSSAEIEKLIAEAPERPVVSCDYGTQNATVFLLWVRGADGASYCVCEYYYSGRTTERQKTDSEYADDLTQWLNGIKIKRVIVDPSAASFIAELRKHGYRVKKARNDVLDGIRYTSTLFKNSRLFIDRSCKNTLKELASYVWDEKAADRGEDKPTKENDHAMDAMRYYCYTELAGGNSMEILR